MLQEDYNCDPHALPDGATTTTGQLVAEVLQTAPEPQRSFEILLKLVGNAMANPQEPKFQEIRKANNIVRACIVSVSPCATLLRRCGFVDKGEHFRLQATGLRLGELSRIRVALAENSLTQEMSNSLNDNILRHFGRQVFIGTPQERNTVAFASAQEVAQAGLALARPGWTAYNGYDADCFQDAHSMSSFNLEACFRVAEENGFGGFCVWEDGAYFRESPGAELKQRLQRAPGASFYVYVPPFQAAAPSARSGSSSFVAPAAGALLAVDDEDDADLQEALRLSMTTS
uniref:PUB domain-containing protein n=1 Tax=Alexandrium monilatum TaxID=311494 RepID=A0A7S4W745_9DINO